MSDKPTIVVRGNQMFRIGLCPACRGTGKSTISSEYIKLCTHCDGTGKMEEEIVGSVRKRIEIMMKEEIKKNDN